LLWLADANRKEIKSEYHLSFRDALIIGLFQILALIPGTSRSGITITAGLFLGLNREAASRFSFLLAIPAIAEAGIYEALMIHNGSILFDWLAFVAGFMVASVSAFVCIHLFLRLIQRIGMVPFVIYRLLLGGFLIAVFI